VRKIKKRTVKEGWGVTCPPVDGGVQDESVLDDETDRVRCGEPSN